MRVFTESPNDITFLHIIICKPHMSPMDSHTLTSVYTYAMITICADSWNSRSVLWANDVFWGSKVSLSAGESIPQDTSKFFFSINRLGKNVARISSCHPTLSSSGGGSTSLCRLDCCSRSTRCRSCSNTSHCCYCSDKNCSGCCSYRQGCCIGSPRKEKDHVSVRGKKIPKKGTERRKGGKGKVGEGQHT